MNSKKIIISLLIAFSLSCSNDKPNYPDIYTGDTDNRIVTTNYETKEIDLGHNTNNKISLNISLGNNSFGLKATNFSGLVGDLDSIQIRLHKLSGVGSTPSGPLTNLDAQTIFDSNPVIGGTFNGATREADINVSVPSSNFTINLNNLEINSTYYVTARVFDTDIITVANQNVTSDGTGSRGGTAFLNTTPANRKIEVNSDGSLAASFDLPIDLADAFSTINQVGKIKVNNGDSYSGGSEVVKVKSGEFQVNNYTTSNQNQVRSAIDSQGNYVLTWTEDRPGTLNDIYYRLFSNKNIPITDPTLVNTTTPRTQNLPSIDMNSNGKFVITWRGGDSINNQDGDNSGIYAQMFSSSGDKMLPSNCVSNPNCNNSTGEFLVNTYTTSGQTRNDISINDSGEFVVVWESNTQDTDSLGIYAQMYNSDGTANGSEFKVNTTIAGNQREPKVDINNNGDFVVVWESDDSNGEGVYAQMYNNLGATIIPSGCGSTIPICNGTTGEFLVNTYIPSNQVEPEISINNSGNFAIVWQSVDQASALNDDDIYLQIYDNLGNPIADEFLVNVYTTLDQRSPDISMNDNGNFIVTWQSFDQEGTGFNNGVIAQKFDSSIKKIDNEFIVNSYTTDSQSLPSVSMNNNGDFLIAWQSNNQVSPSSSEDVFKKLFSKYGKSL